MEIKKGQWFKCTKEVLQQGYYILFKKGGLYQADKDGSIDGIDHGVDFDEHFIPVEAATDAEAFERMMGATLTLAADKKGMLADNDGHRIKLTEEGRREYEIIKEVNGARFWNLPQEKEDATEQPVDIEQELYKHFGRVKDFTLCTAIAKRFYEMGRSHRRPLGEDFGGEIDEEWKHYSRDGGTACINKFSFALIASHFAKWQEQKDGVPTVDGDLEEEIKRYFTCDPEVTLRQRTFGDIARHFASWQKQQMMRDAEEAAVTSRPNDFGEYMPMVTVPVCSSHDIGDKVKVLVIKED